MELFTEIIGRIWYVIAMIAITLMLIAAVGMIACAIALVLRDVNLSLR